LELEGDTNANSSKITEFENQKDFEKKNNKKVEFYEFELKKEFKQNSLKIRDTRIFIQPFFQKKYDLYIHNCYDFSNKIG
jgi:hypothetical protein